MSLRLADVDSWLRVLRTTRYLRSSQIAHRLRRIVLQQMPFQARSRGWLDRYSATVHQPAESLPSVPVFATGGLHGLKLVEQLDRGELRLVNQTRPLAADAPDWRLGPQRENRLWAITLHYHGWLFELSKLIGTDQTLGARAEALLESFLQDWIDCCKLESPGVESLAWNSYAIATRLGWWARLWHRLGKSFWTQRPELAREFLRSMYSQAKHLESNLEWDLRGNHLLRDAVGLAWAGRFFHDRHAARWMKTATRIAVTQADEQTLDDGGHFERSPFYQLEAMDDWLALALLLADESAAQKMRVTWQRSAEHICWLCHPDGCVAQFNDGAATAAQPHFVSGCALSIDAGNSSPRGGRWFQDSGIVVWHGDPWVVFWDVGQVGPDYQPGHAHADTLTIEASYGGHRLFVDPGCHSYDNNAIRAYDRATTSHNTVAIDARDSSEVWHIFRVGRRARPRRISVELQQVGFQGAAAHSGYDHLPGRPEHSRRVGVHAETELQIIDHLTGANPHTAVGGFLIDPDWQVHVQADGWLLTRGEVGLRVQLESNQPVSITTETRCLHPDYGIELLTNRLVWRFEGGFPLTVVVRVQAA